MNKKLILKIPLIIIIAGLVGGGIYGILKNKPPQAVQIKTAPSTATTNTKDTNQTAQANPPITLTKPLQTAQTKAALPTATTSTKDTDQTIQTNPPPTSMPSQQNFKGGETIFISYRLDPWLISGNYGSGFWASPPVLGPVTQGHSDFILEIKAKSLDANKRPTDASLKWISADAGMVAISPDTGSLIKITVKHAGQTELRVTALNTFKILTVKATEKDAVIFVQISQSDG
ncbi:MAG: hypothetical protein HY569_00095 [Candidatus Magasanikbacteria bacterium]|nr:hypothetical protein [Candidatus Magasanikbacteria bacterium]